MSKWKMVKLGDICCTTQGVQIPLSEQIDCEKEGYIQYLYIGDFKDTNRKLYVENKYLQKVVSCEDLVMANTGSPGAVFKGMRGILSNNLFKIAFNKDLLCLEFLYLYLSSNIFQNMLQKKMKGGIQQHLGHKTIAEQLVPLPPLEEQKRIADILDKASNLIDLRKQQLEKMNLLIKSKFIDMFGDPVTNPKGWEVKQLSELGCWNSGGTPSRGNLEYFEGDIDWYSAGELNDLFLKKSNERITNEAIKESAAKLFEAGSLLIGMYDTAAFKMGILTKNASSNQACANIKPNKKTNVLWLYFNLLLMKKHFLQNRRGIRQKNLNLGMIKGFYVPVPPTVLQSEFAAFVELVEKQKAVMQQSLEKMETNYKALMQEYFD